MIAKVAERKNECSQLKTIANRVLAHLQAVRGKDIHGILIPTDFLIELA
jgi:hypothetical protein